MAVGIVKWFNAKKGYGFIVPVESGPDMFVHISELERSGIDSVREGERLEYDVVIDKRSKKPQASNVRRVG